MKRVTAEDPESRSSDLIAANIAEVARLFPDAIAEGKVDFEALRELLGDAVDDGDERYGLGWHGKRHARQLALRRSTATLRPCPEESVDWDSTRNMMIEGDNLEVLKVLQRSYTNKVKLIYIDPPYNTGKDFVYRDNHRDGITNYLKITGQLDGNGDKLCSNTDASGRFHTNWLNMMYPRLKVARTLLREDGIIAVSIDQVELSNLQKIMDELWGEENLFAILTRRAMHTVRNSSKDFNLHADYLLVYGRNKAWWEESPDRYIRQRQDKSASYPHDDGDGRGPYKLDPLHAEIPIRAMYTSSKTAWFGKRRMAAFRDMRPRRLPDWNRRTASSLDAEIQRQSDTSPKCSRACRRTRFSLRRSSASTPRARGNCEAYWVRTKCSRNRSRPASSSI